MTNHYIVVECESQDAFWRSAYTSLWQHIKLLQTLSCTSWCIEGDQSEQTSDPAASTLGDSSPPPVKDSGHVLQSLDVAHAKPAREANPSLDTVDDHSRACANQKEVKTELPSRTSSTDAGTPTIGQPLQKLPWTNFHVLLPEGDVDESENNDITPLPRETCVETPERVRHREVSFEEALAEHASIMKHAAVSDRRWASDTASPLHAPVTPCSNDPLVPDAASSRDHSDTSAPAVRSALPGISHASSAASAVQIATCRPLRKEPLQPLCDLCCASLHQHSLHTYCATCNVLGARRNSPTYENEDDYNDEELLPLPAAEKRRDPLLHTHVKTSLDDVEFHGQIVDVEIGQRTGQKLYLVRFSDGDIMHLSEAEAYKCRVHP